MGWVTTKTYTKECGCKCEDKDHDVDRPFMCYTEYETVTTSRCAVHQQQYEEYLAERQEELLRAEKQREEQIKVLSQHLHELSNIEHTSYTPIKHAIEKYRACRKLSNSDRWVRSALMRSVGNVLLIQKLRSKGVCSQERLHYIDLNIIIQHQRNAILRALTNDKQNQISIEPDSTK